MTLITLTGTNHTTACNKYDRSVVGQGNLGQSYIFVQPGPDAYLCGTVLSVPGMSTDTMVWQRQVSQTAKASHMDGLSSRRRCPIGKLSQYVWQQYTTCLGITYTYTYYIPVNLSQQKFRNLSWQSQKYPLFRHCFTQNISLKKRNLGFESIA